MVKLVLVRHGESIANAENVYTGWNDVPLTDKGIRQARKHLMIFIRLIFILRFCREQ